MKYLRIEVKYCSRRSLGRTEMFKTSKRQVFVALVEIVKRECTCTYIRVWCAALMKCSLRTLIEKANNNRESRCICIFLFDNPANSESRIVLCICTYPKVLASCVLRFRRTSFIAQGHTQRYPLFTPSAVTRTSGRYTVAIWYCTDGLLRAELIGLTEEWKRRDVFSARDDEKKKKDRFESNSLVSGSFVSIIYSRHDRKFFFFFFPFRRIN